MGNAYKTKLFAGLAAIFVTVLVVYAIGVGFPVSMASFGIAPLAAIGSCVAIVAVISYALLRAIAPIDVIGRSIEALAIEAGNLGAIADAQSKLEVNMNTLRDLAYAHGDPRVANGRLYFGDYAVNDTIDLVDEVQRKLGGAATIFLGDLRISTNIKDADGKRQTGTKLSPGPAFESIFGNGRTYRGEAQIFGENYITIYEPIVVGDDIIGCLFVCMKKADTVAAVGRASSAARFTTMAADLETLREIVLGRDVVTRAANAERSDMTDKRRKQKALERITTQAQQRVVQALSAALEQLASSNLTHEIDVAFPPDYQKLKDDFGAAIGALGRAMVDISSETRSMRAQAVEIAGSVMDLSHRTEQQAASLEETAAALDQITQTVRRTSAGATEAQTVVMSTKDTAEHSSVVMRQAISAMEQIETSSRQMGQIIGVIDEIAFQTNLLALNAGVEAARAGEAGRGFAVVAAEVRALAQRSAEAAREIKGLIETSSLRVKDGANLISETNAALNRIVGQVTGLSEIVVTIAQSAGEQALSLNEVNTAINQMDQFTQQNAAMVEESTAAAQTLAQEAGALETLVSQFTVDDSRRDSHDRKPEARRDRIGTAKPVHQMTTTGRGGAMRKPAAAPSGDPDWEEF